MMTDALSLSQKMMMKSALATILVSTAAVLKADAGALKLGVDSLHELRAALQCSITRIERENSHRAGKSGNDDTIVHRPGWYCAPPL